MCNSAECRVFEFELDAVERKKLLVLLIKRVFRLFYNSYERVLVEVVESYYNRQSADKLGNDTVFDDVVRDNVLVNSARNLFLLCLLSCIKADLLITLTALNNRLNSLECASANEENILGIDLNKFLVRMLSAALRRNVCSSTLKNLK